MQKVLKEVAEISDFRLHAYAIMGNHLHLLIETTNEELGTVMKRILLRFTIRYNSLNQRVGHLWQNRFYSDPIENEEQFRCVFRYILRNPIEAGLESKLGLYPWTSFHAYRGIDDDITCTELADTLFANHQDMMQYLQEENTDVCLEVPDPKVRYGQQGDLLAAELMEQEFGVHNVPEFQNLPRDLQRECIRMLKEEGISKRSISRMTGETLYHICRI